ncbi:unnamed protein product [Pylaiella littoralis]
MAVSSAFSRRQRATALFGALAVTALSWAYFTEIWKGVVVSGAGDADANGYYKWEPTASAYIKSAQKPAGAWRVPNVYDLVSRGPEFRKDASPLFFLKSAEGNRRNRHEDQSRGARVWHLVRAGVLEYHSRDATSSLDNTPPSTGWVDAGLTSDAAPGPEVQRCGKRVAPDPDPDAAGGNGIRKGRGAFELGEGPAEILNYPGTVLLLAVNLAFAYHLWAKRVSPDAVCVSYALFWEEREYWRLFTASFSHFEPLHLIFNAMGTWNTREMERLLGTFRYLYLSLNLVVSTIMLVMLAKHALVKWRGLESHRERGAVGFSCVLFAYMTYLAVAMREFCPVGESLSMLCFSTRSIPLLGGLPSLPVNLGPFFSLVGAQVIMPRAGFLGHLSGILMGYLMAWGFLGGISTPILAGASVVFMLQHSKAWARKMPDFSLLLQSWAEGDLGRVARARKLGLAFAAHVCLTVAFSCLFTWGSTVGEVLALIVGFNAVQALRCCCCPDSVPAEHRFCVNLLKAYGALSAILLASDLLSLGAILGQARSASFVSWSGVSELSRQWGVALLVLAAAAHGLAITACIEGGLIFREGQTFLSAIGLKRVVNAYSRMADAAATSATSSGTGTTPSYTSTSAAGLTSGRLYRGGGRALGTAASNRSPPTNATAAATANANATANASASTSARGGRGVTGSSGRAARPPGVGLGRAAAAAGGDEAGFPLLRRGGGEGGGGGDAREIEL